jgi:chromosome partitioning protein
MAQGQTRPVTFWTGNDVLCIDLDPQHGGLTKFVGLEQFRSNPAYNLLEVVFDEDEEVTLRDIIIPGAKTGLSYDLVPSHEDLENFSREITGKYPGNPQMVIRKLIKAAKLFNEYDFILIDVQGSRSQLVANAVVATRNVIAPIELTEKGAGSIEKLESYIKRQQHTLNEERQAMGAPEATLALIGAVPYGLSHGTENFSTLTTDEKEGLYKLYLNQKPVTPFGIPEAAAVTESLSNKITLREFINSDNHRELRSSSCEQVIMDRFESVADIVEDGSINGLDGPYTMESVFTQYAGPMKNEEVEAEIMPAPHSKQSTTAKPNSADD